jgi:ABC-2 type transport system permease protein
MHTISDVIPSAVPAIVDPWLGLSGLGSQLAVMAGWAAVGAVATMWLVRRAHA